MGANKQLDLAIDNPAELFSIIEQLQAKDPFSHQQQAAGFGLGLKLFS